MKAFRTDGSGLTEILLAKINFFSEGSPKIYLEDDFLFSQALKQPVFQV